MLLVRGRNSFCLLLANPHPENLMNVINTAIAAIVVLVALWLARDLITHLYWKFRWKLATGHAWKDPDSEPEARDHVLIKMAQTGDKDRFDQARDLAIKLDTGHPWHGRQSQIGDFDHYVQK